MNLDNLKISVCVRFWGLTLPFLVWVYLHHWGLITSFSDSRWYSSAVTYHFQYIGQGIFPLWNPFEVWGWPDVTDQRSFGEFNPFYLIIPLLTSFKVSPLIAFNIFLILYYWLGTLGLFCLIRSLWGSELLAIVASSMLMFSFLGELLFSQLAVPLMLFPTIWFFYFFVVFFKSDKGRNAQKKYFCGAIFALMIIATSYLPFFFLSVLGAVIVAIVILKPSYSKDSFRKIYSFARMNPILLSCGLLALILACFPGISCYLDFKEGQTVILNAHNGFNSSKGFANVPLDLVSHSGLMAQMSKGEIISDLDFTVCCFTYIPIFILIILSLGIITRINRQQWMVLLAGFFVLLISLGDVTPVHKFLYEHVFIFRLFRNLYFLGPFLLVFLIVIAIGQLKSFLEMRPENRNQRFWYLSYISFIHLSWLVILISQDRIVWTSYVTLAASFIIFILYAISFFDRKYHWLLICLIAVVLIQPFQIISKYWLGYDSSKISYQKIDSNSFQYVRPLRGVDKNTELGYLLSPKQRLDQSGFFQQGYYGCLYSYKLYSNVPADDLEKYVQYKFILYDQVAYMDGKNPDWFRVAKTLRNIENPAWVDNLNAVKNSSLDVQDKPQPVIGSSEGLAVEYFDSNVVRLVTHFKKEKFLVFNDSYHPNWQAFDNGRTIPIYRTNIAFKGIWVKPGVQYIEFKFGSIISYIIRWLILFVFLGWGIYVFFSFTKDKK